MSWYDTVFEVIDMRSFSNLWFWIALAVLWSSLSHWVLGVPFDMITRARRAMRTETDQEALDDLNDLVRVNVNRILYISDVTGVWLLLFGSAALTALAVMATLYGVEFAQAVLLLVLPLSFVGVLSLRTARLIKAGDNTGKPLIKRLMMPRFWTQLIGLFSIFVTALFGMYKNLYVGPIPF